jgi:hypothetical protein
MSPFDFGLVARRFVRRTLVTFLVEKLAHAEKFG